jgi:hypothetical protein
MNHGTARYDNSGGSHGHNGHHRQDRVRNGTYGAMIGGFYKGTGSADVGDDRVSISAAITSRDGATGELIANDLVVEGPYFSGQGTILGQPMTIIGRVDAPRASRLTATFFVSDGHAGRIAARLPSDQDAGDDTWNHHLQGGHGDGDD